MCHWYLVEISCCSSAVQHNILRFWLSAYSTFTEIWWFLSFTYFVYIYGRCVAPDRIECIFTEFPNKYEYFHCSNEFEGTKPNRIFYIEWIVHTCGMCVCINVLVCNAVTENGTTKIHSKTENENKKIYLFYSCAHENTMHTFAVYRTREILREIPNTYRNCNGWVKNRNLCILFTHNFAERRSVPNLIIIMIPRRRHIKNVLL